MASRHAKRDVQVHVLLQDARPSRLSRSRIGGFIVNPIEPRRSASAPATFIGPRIPNRRKSTFPDLGANDQEDVFLLLLLLAVLLSGSGNRSRHLPRNGKKGFVRDHRHQRLRQRN